MKPARLQVGVDISKHRLDVCLLSPDGDLLEQRTFPNTLSGYQALRDLLLAVGREEALAGIDLTAESTGPYWMPLFLQCQQDEALAAWDLQTYLLNAREVYWFKKGAAEAEKTDARDAFHIAEKRRTQRRQPPWGWNPASLRLRFLTRHRFRLGQQRTRLKNAFWALMFLWCNRYGPRRPFSDAFGTCAQALVREAPDWQTLVEPSAKELGSRLDTWSRQGLDDPVETARRLQAVIADSFPLPQELAEVLHPLLRLTLDHLNFVEQQIRQVERLIKQEVQEHHPGAQCLQTIPGIGLVLAAGIAAEIGPLSRFLDGEKWDRRKKRWRRKNLRDVEDAVAKTAGLWWPRKESGDFRAENRRLAKQGNRYLRYYLVEAADRLRQHLPEYRAYYERKYQEVKKHQHKRALVLTARKSVGLFVGLLHRKEAYRSPEERLND